MSLIRRILATNPILFRNAITSVLLLLASFGLQIGDADVNNAVDLVLNIVAVGNVVLSLLDRQAVFSPQTHAVETQGAYERGVFDADPAGAAAAAYQAGKEDTLTEVRAGRLVP